MRKQDQMKKAYEAYIHRLDYSFCHYKKFNYDILNHIYYCYRIGKDRITVNDVIIMCDTETSKKQPDEEYIDNHGLIKYKTHENHVVAWTISIRAFHKNICTLYGRKPSTMAQTMLRIHEHMHGMQTIFYFHNLAYDHWFLRRFWIDLYGKPIHQLNTKPHYPIYVEYSNGIIIKDSLILAQRKLEKWASDLGVEHQKAVGKWDYDKIRNQTGDEPFTKDELEYIEHDTLAGVECIDATMQALNKKIYSIPYTATGIPREQTRKRGGKKAHETFSKMALTLQQYEKMSACYHGGYTHGNRHYINTLIDWKNVWAFDFSSSYPYSLLAFKYPMEKYTPLGEDVSASFIINNHEKYSYMFKFVAVNIKLKSDDEGMPALQFSKCIRTVNAILDNGRILASNYVSIYLTEWDLMVIAEQYTWDKHICTEVEFARKDYLPRWFTDYIYECYKSKTLLKGKDKVLYSIEKSKANSLYGMCVQKPLRDDIVEDYDTGEYIIKDIENPDEEYSKYVNKISSILPYQWGCVCTAIAFYNLHTLIKCCKPLYCDTDSCYGVDWDLDAVTSYNKGCKDKLLANGYGAVIVGDREYWLGIAEHEKSDEYSQFKYMGAKRYCGRCIEDNELHLTVAGVPKKSGALCLSSIDDFHPGFIFSGLKTGKKTHVYFSNEIYIDENGNETGDSISLIPCDYQLDSVDVYDWEAIFNDEIQIQIYDDC